MIVQPSKSGRVTRTIAANPVAPRAAHPFTFKDPTPGQTVGVGFTAESLLVDTGDWGHFEVKRKGAPDSEYATSIVPTGDDIGEFDLTVRGGSDGGGFTPEFTFHAGMIPLALDTSVAVPAPPPSWANNVVWYAGTQGENGGVARDGGFATFQTIGTLNFLANGVSWSLAGYALTQGSSYHSANNNVLRIQQGPNGGQTVRLSVVFANSGVPQAQGSSQPVVTLHYNGEDVSFIKAPRDSCCWAIMYDAAAHTIRRVLYTTAPFAILDEHTQSGIDFNAFAADPGDATNPTICTEGEHAGQFAPAPFLNKRFIIATDHVFSNSDLKNYVGRCDPALDYDFGTHGGA
jgi:hypothetical protein